VQISPSTRVGATGLMALVATYGIGRLAYGLFVPSFSDEFDLSLDVLGYYASGAQAGYLAATLATGVLTVRYGPRVPVVSGCLLLAAGSAVTASATDPVLLAVGVIAAGTSAGGAWAPFSDAVANQVPRSGHRRTLALVNAGSPVGLLVASALLLATGDQWRTVWWVFTVIGLVAAVAAWRVLDPEAMGPVDDYRWPSAAWLFNRRSAPLFLVAVGISITSGAYFSYAPETVQDAGLPSWIGPAMWTVLGVAGAGIGAFAGTFVRRLGRRGPLAATLLLTGGSTLVLPIDPGSTLVALLSAGLFGVGFTTGFALLVIWNQQVFSDRPTTGFTAALVFIAAGFIVGPSLFGVLATGSGRTVALLVSAAPVLVAAFVPPAPDDRRRPHAPW